MLNGPTRRSEDSFISPFYPCGIHGAERGLTLILSRHVKSRHAKLCARAFASLRVLLAHLCVASLHVPQRHLWVDGVAARHAENLQVRVVAVAFVHLRGK